MIRIVLAAAFLTGTAAPAVSHHWYPPECCSDRDCSMAPNGAVEVTPQGYFIVSNGELILYGDSRIRPVPNEAEEAAFHVCHVGGDLTARVLCLFVPPLV